MSKQPKLRYRAISVGDVINTVDRGHAFTVKGQRYGVTEVEHTAITRAAKARDLSIDAFIETCCAHTSAAGAIAAIRRAIEPFLPDDYQWFVVTKRGKS